MDYRIMFLGLFFGGIETAYFGWNFTPQSEAEVVCDGIVILITAIGLLRGRR